MIREYKMPMKYLISIAKYELSIMLVIGIAAHFIAVRFQELIPLTPLAIPAFLGTSISVLLSFKMNQSYDRWWEARKIWGGITNHSRSLVIQLVGLLGDKEKTIIQKIAYRQIAWGYHFGSYLRGSSEYKDLSPYMHKTELDSLYTQQHQPLAMLQLTVQDLKQLYENKVLNIHGYIHLQRDIVELTKLMGGAERINRTIFPSTYRMVLHLMIYLFVITLAIALRDVENVAVGLLALLISSGFLLIEKIAYELQDPFKNRASDVAVTDIAQNIESNIKELLGERATQPVIDTQLSYIM